MMRGKLEHNNLKLFLLEHLWIMMNRLLQRIISHHILTPTTKVRIQNLKELLNDQKQQEAGAKPKKMSAKPTSIIYYAYNCTRIAQRFEHSFGYDLLFRARALSSSPFFY